MKNKNPDAIVIDKVDGGKDRDLLKDCYFLPTEIPGEYNFHDKDDSILARHVSQSNTFSFELGKHHWTVPGRTFLISKTAAFGDWTKKDKLIRDNGDGESGSFQAQSGTSPVEKVASSAKA